MRQCLVAGGFIRDGKLFLSKRTEFDLAVSRITNCRIVLRLEEHENPRSVALNAYYWGAVIHLISEETGYSPEEVHALMKELHLPKRFAAVRGIGQLKGVKVFDGSTTDLSNDEEWEYITNIHEWAAGSPLYLVIPDPNEVAA